MSGPRHSHLHLELYRFGRVHASVLRCYRGKVFLSPIETHAHGKACQLRKEQLQRSGIFFLSCSLFYYPASLPFFPLLSFLSCSFLSVLCRSFLACLSCPHLLSLLSSFPISGFFFVLKTFNEPASLLSPPSSISRLFYPKTT